MVENANSHIIFVSHFRKENAEMEGDVTLNTSYRSKNKEMYVLTFLIQANADSVINVSFHMIKI